MSDILHLLNRAKSVPGFDAPKCRTCGGTGIINAGPCVDFFDGCDGTGCDDNPALVVMAVVRWAVAAKVYLQVSPRVWRGHDWGGAEHDGTDKGIAAAMLRAVLDETT